MDQYRFGYHAVLLSQFPTIVAGAAFATGCTRALSPDRSRQPASGSAGDVPGQLCPAPALKPHV